MPGSTDAVFRTGLGYTHGQCVCVDMYQGGENGVIILFSVRCAEDAD